MSTLKPGDRVRLISNHNATGTVSKIWKGMRLIRVRSDRDVDVYPARDSIELIPEADETKDG